MSFKLICSASEERAVLSASVRLQVSACDAGELLVCGAENSVALLLAGVTLAAAQLRERVRRTRCSSARNVVKSCRRIVTFPGVESGF